LIKGAASSLLDSKLPCEDKIEHIHTLEAIISEANWLERILTRMLDMALIEKGTLKLEKELYPIEGIILNTLDLGHMRSLLKGRIIQKDVPDDLPSVELDPILIGQVLVNLVENALRYTPATSPIQISVRATSDHLLITVADHGPGIPPLEMERIFEKFYRVKRIPSVYETGTTSTFDLISSKQGSGLGLAVCQGFVQAHGGRIWVKNRENGGAEFQFTLPLMEKT
jgi:two-component system sensor histidine kinase KdpD